MMHCTLDLLLAKYSEGSILSYDTKRTPSTTAVRVLITHTGASVDENEKVSYVRATKFACRIIIPARKHQVVPSITLNVP